jgi:antitoxin YobK
MDDQDYQKIVELIKDHPSVAEFANYGSGISSDWVDKAENALGVPLPESYKWWLRNYGGGEIGGEEIYSVYGIDFDKVVGGDIVYMYRLALKNNRGRDHIPLCQSDIDGVFYFKVEDGAPGDEYSIVSEATGREYAINFLEFLEKRIDAFA